MAAMFCALPRPQTREWIKRIYTKITTKFETIAVSVNDMTQFLRKKLEIVPVLVRFYDFYHRSRDYP